VKFTTWEVITGFEQLEQALAEELHEVPAWLSSMRLTVTFLLPLGT
jgi:hypothetical protein